MINNSNEKNLRNQIFVNLRKYLLKNENGNSSSFWTAQ